MSHYFDPNTGLAVRGPSPPSSSPPERHAAYLQVTGSNVSIVLTTTFATERYFKDILVDNGWLTMSSLPPALVAYDQHQRIEILSGDGPDANTAWTWKVLQANPRGSRNEEHRLWVGSSPVIRARLSHAG